MFKCQDLGDRAPGAPSLSRKFGFGALGGAAGKGQGNMWGELERSNARGRKIQNTSWGKSIGVIRRIQDSQSENYVVEQLPRKGVLKGGTYSQAVPRLKNVPL